MKTSDDKREPQPKPEPRTCDESINILQGRHDKARRKPEAVDLGRWTYVQKYGWTVDERGEYIGSHKAANLHNALVAEVERLRELEKWTDACDLEQFHEMQRLERENAELREHQQADCEGTLACPGCGDCDPDFKRERVPLIHGRVELDRVTAPLRTTIARLERENAGLREELKRLGAEVTKAAMIGASTIRDLRTRVEELEGLLEEALPGVEARASFLFAGGTVGDYHESQTLKKRIETALAKPKGE